MQIAILGLGRMGKGLVSKLLDGGHQVVVWNRSVETLEQIRTEYAELIVQQKLVLARSVAELQTVLSKPRVIWSMLPAGEVTEQILQQLLSFVEPGDIVIDGGNARYTDTERRASMFAERGVKFLGIGVSGGVHGVETGFSIMAGGDLDAYEYITPLLDSLAFEEGSHTYFGTGGAGHFVKMVHNGIEYGMMQAIAEGFGLLRNSNYNLDLQAVVDNYQEGSIISSFLLEMVYDALQKDPTLSQTQGVIGTNGEGEWTVEEAHRMKLPIEVIEKSLEFRNRSQTDKALQQTFTAKVVQAMRHEFGGH